MSWMKHEAPWYRRNIHSTTFEEVGVGVATAESKVGGVSEQTFYMIDFGTKRR